MQHNSLRKKKGRVAPRPNLTNPYPRSIRMSISANSPECTGLVLVFRTDEPKQAA